MMVVKSLQTMLYIPLNALAIKTGYYNSITPVTGAKKVDDYTVDITLDSIYTAFPNALVRLYIVNADLLKANEDAGDYGQKYLQNHEARLRSVHA